MNLNKRAHYYVFMRKKLVNNIKVPAKAKKRAAQVNMMQRSSDEMGKFDNTSATSISMGITAVMGLGIEIGFYLFVLLLGAADLL